MSYDDNGDDDRGRSGDGNGKPTRDSNGRWLPGHCPNLNGRPKKKPKEFLSEYDFRIFGKTQIDLVVSGQEVTMNRRTALLYKIFENAMKGKISSQRLLLKKFEENDEQLAALRIRYDNLIMARINGSTRFGNPGEDETYEIELEILGLRTLLNHYFPLSYPLHGVSEDEGGDDG